MNNNRRLKSGIIIVILIFFVIIAGCATISIFVKVEPDTTISNYKVNIETTSMVYSLMIGGIKSNFDSNLFNLEEKWTGDKVTIIITSKVPLQSLDPINWTIKKVNNHMIYEDKRFSSFPTSDEENVYSSAMMNSFSVHYYLEMPGKITNSNADKIDNNKAEWHLQGNEISNTKIYAESELPAFSIPGFEVLITIVGLCIASIVIFKKKGG